MADKCHLCLLGLIFLSSLLTGLSGVDDAHLFISSGEDVRLPCNNALHDCKSTSWIYNRFRHTETVELITGGRKKTDTERHERLSLESDCSLNIKSVTEEDYGLYFCRQYVNNQHQGTDARVYLHVLHVSSSPSQTEISAGLSVTLFCQLYSSSARVSCDDGIRSEGIDLFWVNQAGVKLMRSDSRYQISAPGHCIISLKTTILNEDHNREWRCNITHRDQLQTSVSYTVKISGVSGLSGVDDAHVFISSGEDVRLPCNNALPDCNSTTWNYNRFSYSSAVELFAGGRKKKHIERHERLSLESDCSLNIKSVTKEDCGSYICRQYVNGQQQGTDARVYLHVLHVSSSTSQTEISAGLSLTLFCQLYSYSSYARISCGDWIRSGGIYLFWVNQAGVKLTNSDSRYQISAPDHCYISLKTTILNEDEIREWRCGGNHRDQLKTSVSYTVKISDQADLTTAVTNSQHRSTTNTDDTEDQTDLTHSSLIPVYSTNSQHRTTTNTHETEDQTKTGTALTPAETSTQVIVIVIVVGVSVVLLLPALILWLIRKKRADVRRETDDSVEKTDDVTYTEVTVCRKNRAKKNKVRCDDKVTYASIRGTKAGAQENCSQLYASVNKNHHKSDK
ncbi:uncharacterized protein LOC113100665 [Carassius auratus]|uniref:Uncharacterized protein LOC113100665 n=1 Tax=Carassius auratus TaxID=7957 RepID=A0A6P6PJ35_CARAU|nr:uncharacterized protein LOC113100665 [Carassius auratus]